MCWRDWERVPDGLRKVIWLLKKGEVGPGEKSGKPYPGLDDAVENAIEQARDAHALNAVALERIRRSYSPDDRLAGDQNRVARRDASA